jgi:hypothetical protein
MADKNHSNVDKNIVGTWIFENEVQKTSPSLEK